MFVGRCGALGCLVEKWNIWSASARFFAARLETVRSGLDPWVECRAKDTRRGARPTSSSRRCLELSMSENLAEQLKIPTWNKQMERVPSMRPFRTRSLFRFYKKVKNVRCEYDRLDSWNSTLQAAWYIRRSLNVLTLYFVYNMVIVSKTYDIAINTHFHLKK